MRISKHIHHPIWVMLTLVSFFGIAGENPPKADDEQSEQTATQKAASEKQAQEIVHQRVQVLGSEKRARDTPGSAHFISKGDLETQRYVDIHRILRQVPGVNIQEEDGYGLRPNIGLRGTGVERSQKITLMEDGVLVAPAPYTAPAAYYFPTAGRMESIELVKGSSSVKHGPYTNGGALNLVSSSVPGELSADLTAATGSDALKRVKGTLGDSGERFGWLLETFQLDNDGFKDLDNGGDTGVRLEDYMGKFRVNSSPAASIYQSLELKLGKTEQFGDETYLGLTQQDFDATPNRRYAASQEDFIDTDHEQFQLRHYIQPFANFDLTTTLYRNNFARNWHKVERAGGVSNGTILSEPQAYPLLVGLLRGEINSDDPRLANGELTIRNNNREYVSQGIQTVANLQHKIGSFDHEFELGLRFHTDEEDRLQHDEAWGIFDGDLALQDTGAPGSQTNRFSDAEAMSLYITDTVTRGPWSFRPGLRFETIEYRRLDYSTSDPTRTNGPSRIRENDVDILLPGLGTTYHLSQFDRVFFGIHKGFSPPGAGQNAATDPEESWNYELGYRRYSGRLSAEFTGFFNDYDNLLGTETVSGGGEPTGELFNGGEVEVYGLEASVNYEFELGTAITLPVGFNYTYTDSEFKTSFETSFADWEPFVEAGDALPYIPKQQFTGRVSMVWESLSLDLSGNYVDEMRTNAGTGPIPENQRIESHLVFDLSAQYRFSQGFQAFLQLRNATDEAYAVSRRPYGLRPGLPRTFVLGLSAKF